MLHDVCFALIVIVCFIFVSVCLVWFGSVHFVLVWFGLSVCDRAGVVCSDTPLLLFLCVSCGVDVSVSAVSG